MSRQRTRCLKFWRPLRRRWAALPSFGDVYVRRLRRSNLIGVFRFFRYYFGREICRTRAMTAEAKRLPSPSCHPFHPGTSSAFVFLPFSAPSIPIAHPSSSMITPQAFVLGDTTKVYCLFLVWALSGRAYSFFFFLNLWKIFCFLHLNLNGVVLSAISLTIYQTEWH